LVFADLFLLSIDTMGAALSLMASVALPLGSGFAVGLATNHEIKGWYAGLKKPKWNPPNWLFGPAWSVFYTSMGVASWFVLQQKGGKRGLPLALYGAQLALNLAWTPLFFKQHALDLALADSVALLGVATAATVKMAEKRPEVIYPLMAPYLCWVTFATALNAEILRLNPEETAVDYKKAKKDVSDGAGKAAAAAKDTADKAATKAKEAGDAVAAKAQQVSSSVRSAAAEVTGKAEQAAGSGATPATEQ
jgi:benzodiazapine receptor